jgi:hypothetical protein
MPFNVVNDPNACGEAVRKKVQGISNRLSESEYQKAVEDLRRYVGFKGYAYKKREMRKLASPQ